MIESNNQNGKMPGQLWAHDPIDAAIRQIFAAMMAEQIPSEFNEIWLHVGDQRERTKEK